MGIQYTSATITGNGTIGPINWIGGEGILYVGGPNFASASVTLKFNDGNSNSTTSPYVEVGTSTTGITASGGYAFKMSRGMNLQVVVSGVSGTANFHFTLGNIGTSNALA